MLLPEAKISRWSDGGLNWLAELGYEMISKKMP